MQTKFTASTNIIRDSSRHINYIPTPNAIQVVHQIENDFKKGFRSFNIIGSYGTGKSSFLWALQQSLNKKKSYFNINLMPNPKVEIIPLIGDYQSIKEAFADYFEVRQTKYQAENIFSEIFNRYHDLGKKNPLLILIIDEFGKFLEYAVQNSPEKELFFLQQLSEFVNNPDHNIILITSVHQNFDAYTLSLNNLQKQEWVKVKGRFQEITFNEPVEQLLFLAAEHLKNDNIKIRAEVKSILAIAKKSKAFKLNTDFASEITNKLFPLDLFTAYILTLSLQKYGQNERSLFSFLESTDYTGINGYDKVSNPFFNISCLYDYLVFNFYSFINSRYNPDFSAWSSIKSSLEEVERKFDNEISEYSKILKTLGLLNIFAASGSNLDRDFLVSYCRICLGIRDSEKLIDNLVNKKIIIYRKYSNRFVPFEGTDLDITSALIAAGDKVNEISDVPTILNRYYQIPPVFAKSYSYVNGTPRLFEFKISEHPISEVPLNEIDGYINLIFNEKLNIDDIKKVSVNEKEAIIYGFYRNSKTIKNLLFEIEKTRKVIDDNKDDKVAVKELTLILSHQQNLLNHYILNNLYSKKSDLIWIFKGQEVLISNKKQFNVLISGICKQIYSKSPVFKNELVNKHKISGSIHAAKKNYFKSLVYNWNLPDLGFEKDKFPPEKTIYLTLLKENGIELHSNEPGFETKVAKKSSFNHLWNKSLEFLKSAKESRRKISELSFTLSRRPFKLKQGLIDFWVGTFLFIKRDDFALFGENGYIPYLNEEILELVMKYPDNYEIKTFDIEGVKLDIFNSYRMFLNQHLKDNIDNATFIETIKPFLTFYRGLSEYSRNTNRLSKETLAIRNAISNSRDPEKSFFDDFPLAMGYTIEELQQSKDTLHNYAIKLQDSIRELRSSYDNLLNRFEEFILNEFIGDHIEFAGYKTLLQKRFTNLKKHLCLPHQKIFLQRLASELDDKKAWLNSIAQAVLGKTLESIKDEEEIILYDKFKLMIHELDDLTNILKVEIDVEKEEVLSVEFSSFINGSHKAFIRLPKTKLKEISKIEDSIILMLSKDDSLDKIALANVLNKLLQK